MKESDKEKEYKEAIDSFGGLIAKICYYFSSNNEEFKDLRQEVLLNIWKGWDKFRCDSKISTWIYRVSFNTCVSFQRKEKYNKDKISIDNIIDLPAERDSNLLEKYNTMHSLIQKLSLQERAIILMWLDDKSYEEIAYLMGINRNSLAVKLKRIKEKLVKMSGENK